MELQFAATNPVKLARLLCKTTQHSLPFSSPKRFSPYQLSVSNRSGVKCYFYRYTSVLMFRGTVIIMLLIFLEESGYQCSPIVQE